MRLGILLALALVPGIACAQSVGTMTKRDLRTQPPAATDRQLRDQLWSIFRKQDRRTKTLPRAALDDVWLETKPYATEVDGLCRYDIVVMRFAPDPAIVGRDDETPSRAYGVESYARFRFVRDPRPGDDENRSDDPWRDRCRSIDPGAVGFFAAPGTQTARAGYAAWQAAVGQLRGGSLKVDSCDRFPADIVSCEQIILAAAKRGPESIDRCDAPGSAECFKIDVDGMNREISIVRVTDRAYRDAQGKGAAVGTIVSLGITSNLIIADQLID